MIGKRVSHYKILEKLGEGGMGVVYKAEDLDLKREVAIKFLPRQIAGSAEERERLKIEAWAAAALNHPNIATIHAIEEHDDESFIVLEYIEGRELREIIRSEIPNAQSAIDYATQIAAGLQAAHEKGVVHRDIKSSNIMVTTSGQVKIMDFGLAKIGGGAQLTKSGMTMGTAAYMSPEQARGEKVDHRTDIWSFGVVLYEMLTGELPFKGDYEQAVMYAILNEDPAPIAEVCADVPDGLQQIIQKALAREPAERYASCREVLDDLRAQKQALPSATSSLASFAAKPTSKRRLAMWLAPAFLIALAGLWFLTPFQPSGEKEASAPRPQTVAVMPFSVRGGEQTAYLKEGMVDLLSAKLDGVGELRSVDPNALLSYLGDKSSAGLDPRNAREIATHFGAGLYILGSVVKVGDGLQLNASLYNASGEQQTRAQSLAEDEAQLLSAIDRLALQIVPSQFQDAILQSEAEFAAHLTHSFDALKAYLESARAFRAERFQEAIDAAQRAVAADSNFAVAWIQLFAAATWNAGNEELGLEALDKAIALKERLPAPVRHLTLSYKDYVDGQYRRVESRLRSLLETSATRVHARISLGDLYFHYNPYYGRSITAARPQFEKLLWHRPSRGLLLPHLMDIAALEGRTASLDSLLRLYRSRENAPGSLQWQALLVFSGRDTFKREEMLGVLAKSSPTNIARVLGRVAGLVHDLPTAERLAEMLSNPAQPPEWQARGHHTRGKLAVAAGQLQLGESEFRTAQSDFPALMLAQRVLRAAMPAFPVDRETLQLLRSEVARWDTTEAPLTNLSGDDLHSGSQAAVKTFLLGLLDFRAGDWDAVRQRLLSLERHGGRDAASFAKTLRAFLAWRDGRNEEALDLLDAAQVPVFFRLAMQSPFYHQSLNRYVRAEILFAEGRYEEAIDWYASLVDNTSVSWGFNYLGPSYLRRAEGYEKLGDLDKALEFYGRFVELWQNCDPVLRPMLEEAKQKRERLLLESMKEPQEKQKRFQTETRP